VLARESEKLLRMRPDLPGFTADAGKTAFIGVRPRDRRMVTDLTGDVERAVDVACSRYAMARMPLMRMDAPWAVADPERLLAALLFPLSDSDRVALVRRWLRPQRNASEVTHA